MNIKKTLYPRWFLAPAFLLFALFFLLPTLMSIPYSFMVWDLSSTRFVGLYNYIQFFTEGNTLTALRNSFVYAFLTAFAKLILAYAVALLLSGKMRTRGLQRSVIFFPNIVSGMVVGIVFSALMHPSKGLINQVLVALFHTKVNWLTDPKLALFSVCLVDIWKGLSVCTVIFLAGLTTIDREYYEAAKIDGASGLQQLRYITTPLVVPTISSVLVLNLISAFRSFDLIWVMTGGGPGFSSDVMASIVYKEYTFGFYGLSTAGNVIMFMIIAAVVFPLQHWLSKKEANR